MASVILNIPETMDITALVQALEQAGIMHEIQDDYGDDDIVPYDVVMARAFADMTPQELAGGRLKITRQEARLTQRKLAEMLGENTANISAMERGKRAISKKMANKLAKVFNVSHRMFL